MPLKSGKSRATISANIRELYKANETKPSSEKRPRDQIIAIAMSQARKTGKLNPHGKA
jgi:hypothetical protein